MSSCCPWRGGAHEARGGCRRCRPCHELSANERVLSASSRGSSSRRCWYGSVCAGLAPSPSCRQTRSQKTTLVQLPISSGPLLLLRRHETMERPGPPRARAAAVCRLAAVCPWFAVCPVLCAFYLTRSTRGQTYYYYIIYILLWCLFAPSGGIVPLNRAPRDLKSAHAAERCF